MTGTNAFFDWFYSGLNGLGGWLIFLLLAAAAVIWLLYDTSSRHIPALGWRMATILTALLLLPAIIYRFMASNPDSPLAPFGEVIFYLGLLGGLLPAVLAIGYFVQYRGLTTCPNGHVYEAALGQCPECARLTPARSSAGAAPQPVEPPVPVRSVGAGTMPPPPQKPKVQAWLSSPEGRTYQLCQGETTIGRSVQNDIVLQGDTTVGRTHAKIVEQNGRFRLLDLGTKNFTHVNGHVVREPVLLEADDEIRFGDRTTLRFVSSHH